MNFRTVVKIIEDDGWHLIRQKGSHRQFKHPTKRGTVTIAFHQISEDVSKGTLSSILKQAQIEIK